MQELDGFPENNQDKHYVFFINGLLGRDPDVPIFRDGW
jgi:hypothetical protein